MQTSIHPSIHPCIHPSIHPSIQPLGRQRQQNSQSSRENKQESSSHGNNKYFPKSKRKPEVFIMGDSMIKFIKEDKLPEDYMNKSYVLPGANAEDMVDFIKPIARRRPEKIIVHVGTNNVKTDKPNQVAEKIIAIAEDIAKISPATKIGVSGIILRQDQKALNDKIAKINSVLNTSCTRNGWYFIDNGRIDKDCLNRGGLHLNRKGIFNLATNFKSFITSNEA